MVSLRRARVGSGFALAALLAVGAVVGCGDGGGSRGGTQAGGRDAVEVTYYYLPG